MGPGESGVSGLPCLDTGCLGYVECLPSTAVHHPRSHLLYHDQGGILLEGRPCDDDIPYPQGAGARLRLVWVTYLAAGSNKRA